MATIKKLAPFVVILFGFAARVYAMDTSWIDGDRANPHGIGIVILDLLSHGATDKLPLFSDVASVGLPNPPLISYLFAAIAFVDRSLAVAIAIGLIANTLAIACTFVIGKRVLSWEAGLLSATLLAASNWGIYLARGTWHPAHMEVGFVLVAWLLMLSVPNGKANRKRLFAGFVAAAITAGTYLVNFIVLVQATLATFAALATNAWRPPLRRTWLAGVGVCAAAVVVYILALANEGLLSSITNPSFVRTGTRSLTEAELLAHDISPMNREPLAHFARLASGADYALIWTDPRYLQYEIRQPLTQAQAYLVTLFMAIGLAWMLANIRRPLNRFLLTWAAIPIVTLFAIVFFKRGDFGVMLYYLLATSPAPYICGGVGLAVTIRGARLQAPTTIALCTAFALAIVPTWNLLAAAQTVYEQPYSGTPVFMPLRWAQMLGDFWRAKCREFNGADDRWWEISLMGASESLQRGDVRYNDLSDIWSVLPNGGTCALKQSGAPLPYAETLSLQLDDGTVLHTYRSLPYVVTHPPTLTVNLGWTLLDFTAPLRATSGSTISVEHAWYVDALPSEPHDTWYFAPFVKLIAPDGKVVVDIDRASALVGWAWRPNEIMLSEVRITLPKDLPSGTYMIQSTLFDPNQKKNAVYFNANESDTPILTLERTIRIERDN